MEKDWPPLKECAQYKCGMVDQYMKKFDWEDEELSDEKTYYYTSDDDEEEGRRKISYKPSSLKTFLEQVRNSRGYDVDINPPSFMYSPFWLVEPGAFVKEASRSVELAIEYITSKTRKCYQHVDTLKYVYSLNRVTLVTFTAKEDAVDAEEQTFLATAFTPGHALEEAKLLECLLKPEGPAPWNE